MSKKALAFSTLLLMAAPMALHSAALAAGPSGRAASDGMPETQFCKELVKDVPWLSVGECIALNLSSDAEKHNFLVHHCDGLRDEGILEQNYSSYSECVQDD